MEKRLEELNDYFKLNNIKKLKDIFRHSKYAINIIHTPEKFKNIFFGFFLPFVEFCFIQDFLDGK